MMDLVRTKSSLRFDTKCCNDLHGLEHASMVK